VVVDYKDLEQDHKGLELGNIEQEQKRLDLDLDCKELDLD
jgi:hypothetical protein